MEEGWGVISEAFQRSEFGEFSGHGWTPARSASRACGRGGGRVDAGGRLLRGAAQRVKCAEQRKPACVRAGKLTRHCRKDTRGSGVVSGDGSGQPTDPVSSVPAGDILASPAGARVCPPRVPGFGAEDLNGS